MRFCLHGFAREKNIWKRSYARGVYFRPLPKSPDGIPAWIFQSIAVRSTRAGFAGIAPVSIRLKSRFGNKTGFYRDVALIGVGAFLIIGIASQFEQWMKERGLIHLEFSAVLLLIAGLYYSLLRNRTEVAICALGLVALLGVVGTFLNQTLIALPLIVLCGFLAYLLIRRETARSKPDR